MADRQALARADGGLAVSDDAAKLAVDLAAAAAGAAAVVGAVGAKGALQVKNAMRRDASRSQHFRLAQHISYEQTRSGPAWHEWQIGPEAQGAGNLAGIAYFGGVRGGGGTIRDPQLAADEEAAAIEAALSAVIGRLL